MDPFSLGSIRPGPGLFSPVSTTDPNGSSVVPTWLLMDQSHDFPDFTSLTYAICAQLSVAVHPTTKNQRSHPNSPPPRTLDNTPSTHLTRETRKPPEDHQMRVSLCLSSPNRFLQFCHRPNSPNPSMASGSGSLMWFRKGLRIHDNPALQHAAKESDCVYPVFVIDPYFMEPDPNAFSPGSSRAGLNRIRFLLESLVDLDSSLRQLGSRLLVLKGDPGEVIIRCLKEV